MSTHELVDTNVIDLLIQILTGKIVFTLIGPSIRKTEKLGFLLGIIHQKLLPLDGDFRKVMICSSQGVPAVWAKSGEDVS